MADKIVRILIVEDNPDHALIIEREFKKFFVDVIVDCAENGEECLEKLAWNEYSAIILDYSLPEMSGLDVLIKIFEDCFDIPVIMISGHGNEKVAASAIKSGAFDYIVKGPDYASHLINTVTSAIDKHKLKRELNKKDAELKNKSIELDKRDEELRTLDMMKSAMLTNMIHYIKTPLVSIRGYNDLILNEKLGPITTEQKNGLEISIKNVDKLIHYIDNYFNFSSADEIEQIDIGSVNINETLENSVTTLLPKAIKKKIKISLDSTQSNYHIKGDERRLFQAFVNILDSMITMTNSDGIIKIRIINEEEGHIELLIETNSLIKELERAESYKEERKIIRKNISISEEIISFHNGSYKQEVDNNRFKIIITLPFDEISSSTSNDVIKQTSNNKRGTILIVDDDKDCLDLLSMVLSHDYSTISIKSGKKAFDILENNDVDLILLDINMYDINGIDACRQIKQDPRFSKIPVYMISATLGEDKKQLSLDAGASGFIEKPFEMETIINFINGIFPKN